MFCASSGLRGSVSLILAQAVVTEVPQSTNPTAQVRPRPLDTAAGALRLSADPISALTRLSLSSASCTLKTFESILKRWHDVLTSIERLLPSASGFATGSPTGAMLQKL